MSAKMQYRNRNVKYSQLTLPYLLIQEISRKNDKAVKIMIKTQILLEKTEANRRLGLGVFLFYSELAPTDP